MVNSPPLPWFELGSSTPNSFQKRNIVIMLHSRLLGYYCYIMYDVCDGNKLGNFRLKNVNYLHLSFNNKIRVKKHKSKMVFIKSNSFRTTHWSHPLEKEGLPTGWEKIDSPEYGTYYVK